MKNTIKLVVLMLLMFSSCVKERQDSGVPLVSVNLYIYTTDPSFFNLNPIGGWEYVLGGSRGIVIYRQSENDFLAFDRHCTYNVSGTCGRVFIDDSNIIALDTCCGSSFLLTDGSVLEGPANIPLKSYQTSFDGNLLRVYN